MEIKRRLLTEEQKQKKAIYQRAHRWDHNHWEDRLWRGAKGSAKARGLIFEIDKEDIIIPEICPILSVPLITGAHPDYYPKHNNTASLDRVDSTKGYIKENIWVISWLANKMKQDATHEQLLAFCRGYLNLYKEKYT